MQYVFWYWHKITIYITKKEVIHMTCSDLAFKLIHEYAKYTQQELSKRYNIPLDVIARLTKQFNINRRILEKRKFLVREDEVLYLAPYAPLITD